MPLAGVRHSHEKEWLAVPPRAREMPTRWRLNAEYFLYLDCAAARLWRVCRRMPAACIWCRTSPTPEPLRRKVKVPAAEACSAVRSGGVTAQLTRSGHGRCLLAGSVVVGAQLLRSRERRQPRGYAALPRQKASATATAAATATATVLPIVAIAWLL